MNILSGEATKSIVSRQLSQLYRFPDERGCTLKGKNLLLLEYPFLGGAFCTGKQNEVTKVISLVGMAGGGGGGGGGGGWCWEGEGKWSFCQSFIC